MSDRDVNYRAVHVKTPWRKAKGHVSIDNALFGKDGAVGLFANKVRINYVQHGVPLFVLVWRDGEEVGYVARPDISQSIGVAIREIPIELMLRYEEEGGASASELGEFFVDELPSAEETSLGEDQAGAVEAGELVVEEGALMLVEHIERERDAALAALKRKAVLAAFGRLQCEACDFDFGEVYGELGEGFCEVHHLRPLSQRAGAGETTLEDLAVLCSNCHSIIHRTSPIWPVINLRAHLAHVSRSRIE